MITKTKMAVKSEADNLSLRNPLSHCPGPTGAPLPASALAASPLAASPLRVLRDSSPKLGSSDIFTETLMFLWLSFVARNQRHEPVGKYV